MKNCHLEKNLQSLAKAELLSMSACASCQIQLSENWRIEKVTVDAWDGRVTKARAHKLEKERTMSRIVSSQLQFYPVWNNIACGDKASYIEFADSHKICAFDLASVQGQLDDCWSTGILPKNYPGNEAPIPFTPFPFSKLLPSMLYVEKIWKSFKSFDQCANQYL